MNENLAYKKIQEIKKFIKESETDGSDKLIESIEKMERSEQSYIDTLKFITEHAKIAIRNRTIDDLLDDEN